MAGTITVGELLSDPTSGNKITIGSGTTLDLASGAGSVTGIKTVNGGSLVGSGDLAVGGGKLLQIQYVNSTTEFTVNGTTEADLSGMTATITPASTSSKILCMYTTGLANNNSGSYITMRLYRGSTALASIVAERNAYYDYQMATITYVDSPSTTSATTYKITGQRSASGQHHPGINGTSSSLVLMEIE